MINIWNLYSPYLLFLSALFFIGIALYIIFAKLVKRPNVIKAYTILILCANAAWIIFYGVGLISSNIKIKEICAYATAICNVFVPIHWLFYVFHSAVKKINLRIIYSSILAVILTCFLLLISTNSLHHIFWNFAGTLAMRNVGHLIIDITCLVILVIGCIFLIRNLSMPFYIFRWQAFTVILAAAFPFMIITFENFLKIRLLAPFTLVPYSFILSTWIIRLTKTRFGGRDIIAVSRASFFENINDVILVLDKNDIIIDINPAATLLLKQEMQAVLGKQINAVWPELAGYLFRYATENERINYIAFDYYNKKHFYDIEISHFRDWESKVISRIVVLHDITERKNAEEELRKSEEKFRNLIKQSIDGIIIIDENGAIAEWNDGMEKITGVKKEAVINMPAWDMFVKFLYINIDDPGEIYSIKEKIKEALDTGNAAWLNRMRENTIIHTDGYNRTIEQQVFPIKTSKGYSLGSIIRDITANRQLEIERIKSSKLESLGILAGGIAHDFNNILTTIFGNLSMAKLLGDNEKLSKLLMEAESACLQAKNLTLQLLTFAKGGEPICKTTSIVDVVKNAAGFSLRGSNVHYEIITNNNIWPVDVDTGQMNQVISNLVINAVQAMPGGGTIRIYIDNVYMEESDLFPLSTGKYIKIAVADTGIGIPPQNLPKIFDPYFTTKEKGSGLGLAITYNIIKRHFGYLTVDSIVGAGTTFNIYLMASDKELIPEENKQTEINNKDNSNNNTLKLKVLIMDDELGVRNILQQMLELIGHSAICTAEGTEAITAYKRALNSQEPFDIVIMDLTIPGGMGGKDTITKLLEIDIDVKAIVSSGYSNDPILANYKKYGFKGFLPKPYKLSELESVINSVVVE